MANRLVDFHCHLDLFPNHEEEFKQCAQQQIEILSVTTTPRAWKRNKELAAGNGLLRIGLGLHPQLVAEGHNEIELFEKLLHETRYVGEVGLDAGPQFYKGYDSQRKAFERVLRMCAEQGDKILSVHAVRSIGEVLRQIEAHFPPGKGKAVLHWFSGSKSEVKRAAELGCYFSINAEMLRNDQRREIVLSIPKERMLTETDGPFTQVAGRPSEPSDVAMTLTELAEILNVDVKGLNLQILKNLAVLESA